MRGRHIKHHFVTGLNDANLKMLALMHHNLELELLMTYLEEVHENADRVNEATRRLRAAQVPNLPVVANFDRDNWVSHGYEETTDRYLERDHTETRIRLPGLTTGIMTPVNPQAG